MTRIFNNCVKVGQLTHEILSLISGELEKPQKSAGVKQFVPRFPKHERQFLVIVGHELRLGRLLRQRHHPVNILDSLRENRDA